MGEKILRSYKFNKETVDILQKMAKQRGANISETIEWAIRELQRISLITGLDYDKIPDSTIAEEFKRAIEEYEKWKDTLDKILNAQPNVSPEIPAKLSKEKAKSEVDAKMLASGKNFIGFGALVRDDKLPGLNDAKKRKQYCEKLKHDLMKKFSAENLPAVEIQVKESDISSKGFQCNISITSDLSVSKSKIKDMTIEFLYEKGFNNRTFKKGIDGRWSKT